MLSKPPLRIDQRRIVADCFFDSPPPARSFQFNRAISDKAFSTNQQNRTYNHDFTLIAGRLQGLPHPVLWHFSRDDLLSVLRRWNCGLQRAASTDVRKTDGGDISDLLRNSDGPSSGHDAHIPRTDRSAVRRRKSRIRFWHNGAVQRGKQVDCDGTSHDHAHQWCHQYGGTWTCYDEDNEAAPSSGFVPNYLALCGARLMNHRDKRRQEKLRCRTTFARHAEAEQVFRNTSRSLVPAERDGARFCCVLRVCACRKAVMPLISTKILVHVSELT